ncbi:MAG: hypothetical protein AAGE52_27845 [Myxococcota bacterium]
MRALFLALLLACGGSGETSDEPAAETSAEETEGSEEAVAPEPEVSETDNAAQIAADFEQICRAATGAAESSSDAGRRRMAYAMAVANVLQSAEAQNAFRAAGAAADNEKEGVLQIAAGEVGLGDWSCPDLELIYGPQQ